MEQSGISPEKSQNRFMLVLTMKNIKNLNGTIKAEKYFAEFSFLACCVSFYFFYVGKRISNRMKNILFFLLNL
jgi:hypothetical protein